MVAAVSRVLPKGGEPSLEDKQRADPKLRRIIDYLTLPEHSEAQELIQSRSLFEVVDNVLYRVQPDKTLRIIPPPQDREELFREAHGGVFGGYLRDAKVHSKLAKHYWCPRMRQDIVKWCCDCITCASHHIGQ